MKQALNFSWSYIDHFNKEYLSSFPKNSELIDIPHNIKDVPYNYFDEKIYQKVVMYEKRFDLENHLPKQILVFEGFMLQADIYLNDKYLGHFISGYLPVRIDVSDVIKETSNRLVVVLDSNEDKNIPPFGYAVDYLTFSGIYREVYLESHENTYLENFYIHADKDGKVNIIYDKIGNDKVIIEHELYLDDNLITTSNNDEFIVRGVYLWELDKPILYTIKTIVKIDDIEEVYYNNVAFRNAEFRLDGFYLNDKKVHLIGLNRHQLFPYVGAAMPKSMQIEDARLLKEIGVNIVRESHYPQSEHFLNECDQLGLLVINEVPGWQFISKEEVWRNNYYDFIKRLVLKERNHPSLVAYGVRIDESIDDHELYKKGNEIAHTYDKYRQTLGVRNSKHSELLEDIYAYNDFTCWNKEKGVENPKKVSKDKSPYLITEYMGHMNPLKATSDMDKMEEVALHHLRVIDDSYKYERISGCIGWCFVDYYTHVDFGSGDHICTHGVLDMFRNKKFSSFSYETNQDDHPFLEVLTNMKPGDQKAAMYKDIYVFTNADYIKLYKNDEFVKTYYPNHSEFKNVKHPPIKIDDILGETFHYNKFTKKENERLARIFSYGGMYGYGNLMLKDKFYVLRKVIKYHLTWDDLLAIWNNDVATWGGYAKAFTFVGYKDNKEVIKRRIAPYLRFKYVYKYDRTILSNEETYDVLPIRISYQDEDGNIMNYASRAFKVETTGPIKLIGPEINNLLGGQMTVYVRSLKEKGKAKIKFTFEDEIKEIELEVK